MQVHHGVGPNTKPFAELDTSVRQPQIVHMQDTNMIAASLLYTEIGPGHVRQESQGLSIPAPSFSATSLRILGI